MAVKLRDVAEKAGVSIATVSEVYRRLADRRIDELIVPSSQHDPILPYLINGNLPAVAIADSQELLPSIVADDAQGMRLLVSYLWEQGHRRALYLRASFTLTSVETRCATFQEHVSALGGDPLVLSFPRSEPDAFLKALFTQPHPPTAICSWNDDSAYVLLRAALNAGLRVPEDIAIVGFDGLLEDRLPAHKLVTIAVPWEQIASEAVKQLIHQRKGQEAPALTRFPVALVAGDTA